MTNNDNLSKVIKSVNSVKELIELKNKVTAAIWAAENKIKEGNSKTLIEEVLNFWEGVGDGYRAGDYYAPARYYSTIPGVKNFRWRSISCLVEQECDEYDNQAYLERVYADLEIPEGNELLVIGVKVTSPAGYLIPDRVDLEGVTIIIAEVCESSRFSWKINY